LIWREASVVYSLDNAGQIARMALSWVFDAVLTRERALVSLARRSAAINCPNR